GDFGLRLNSNGVIVAAMPENLIFCSRCGAQNSGAALVCQNCGAGLSVGLAPGQSAAPARAYAPTPPVAYAPVPSAPYGGFWMRLLAHLIDHIILGVVAAPLLFLIIFSA